MSPAGHASASAALKHVTVTIPPMGIALSVVATVFLGGGAFGLLEPATVAQLGAPAVAWSLIAVGSVLDVAAITVVLRARKIRARQGG